MAKNNALINSLREVARRNRELRCMEASLKETPEIFSAVTISLWRNIDEPEETKIEAIKGILSDAQEVWSESYREGVSIVEWCERLTGFNILNEGEEVDEEE